MEYVYNSAPAYTMHSIAIDARYPIQRASQAAKKLPAIEETISSAKAWLTSWLCSAGDQAATSGRRRSCCTLQKANAQWADNGPGWIVVLLDSAKAVLDIEPARDHPTRLDIGIVGPYCKGAQPAFELRALFTDHHGAIREDPVTGSLNASTAQWLFATSRATTPYTASQGARVGRVGRIHISQDEDKTVWVAGNTTTLVEGHVTT